MNKTTALGSCRIESRLKPTCLGLFTCKGQKSSLSLQPSGVDVSITRSPKLPNQCSSHSHCIGGETEAQGDQVTCPMWESWCL